MRPTFVVRAGVKSSARQLAELLQQSPRPQAVRRQASLIGVPMHFGQPITGVDQGPGLLRRSGLYNRLAGLGWKINEMGDIALMAPEDSHPKLDPKLGVARHSYAIGHNMKLIADTVHESLTSGHNDFTLVLGGDHTIAAGSVAGAIRANPNLGVIWVDAHADINTPATSPSGNMHGMPLSFVVPGLVDHSVIPGFEWMAPYATLQPSQIVYIGLRDVDPGEIQIIHDLGILTFTMYDIDRFGIGTVMEIAADHLKGRPLHLSYDIDALDPSLAAATGTAVKGGLSFREGHFIAEFSALTGQLKSMDMVEVNPELGDPDRVRSTVEMAVDLVSSAMGKHIL